MDQNKFGISNSIPPVTLNIILISLILLLADMFLPQVNGQISILKHFLALFSIDFSNFVPTDHFMPHQLITYMFMHEGFSHFFFNMFGVFMFGRTLETIWGGKKFLLFYILAGIGAGLTQLIISYITGNPSITIGASGAVFGILVAFGMLFPNSELFIIPFPFPIKAKWFVIGYGVFELILGVSSRVNDNVAHFAHIGGLITGFLIVFYWKKSGKIYDQRW